MAIQKNIYQKVLPIVFLLAALAANAQHNHGGHDNSSASEHAHKQEPPHGGELKDVGKYHLEIIFHAVASAENFSLYVLKSNFKTLETKGITGMVSVKYKDGTEQTYALNNDGVDMLSCHIKEASKGFSATVKITYKGKNYTCFYQYNGLL